MISAAKLDVALYESVEADQSATPQAMTVVIISALAAGIGGIRMGFMSAIIGVIGALVGWVLWSFLCYIIGTKLLPEPTTKADLGELLRTTGFAQSPGVIRILGIIPGFFMLSNLIAMVWMLIAMVVGVRQALDYKSTPRTIGVVAIGFVAVLFLNIMIAVVVGAASIAAAGLSG